MTVSDGAQARTPNTNTAAATAVSPPATRYEPAINLPAPSPDDGTKRLSAVVRLTCEMFAISVIALINAASTPSSAADEWRAAIPQNNTPRIDVATVDATSE